MIDLHCHILYGVDDGARTLEDSVRMARMAAEAGTKTIVATPHMLHPQFHVPGPLAQSRHAEVVAAVAEAGIDIEIVLGGEIHFSSEIEEGLDSGELLPLCRERRYILFELPFSHVPDVARNLCFNLQLQGIYPVLAHPERNVDFAKSKTLLRDYRDAGIPVQVTAMSLTGDFGYRAKKASRRWLAEGLVDLVASDGHSARSRPPVMDEAARLVRKLAGESAEEWVMTEVPRRILAGEQI